MVCQVCGRSVEAEDRFCTGCGVSLVEHPPTGDAATTPTARADSDVEPASATPADPVEAEPAAAPAPPIPTAGSDAPTELVELTEDDGWGEDDPVWAVTAPTPRITSASATRTSDLPTTEPITEVWPSAYDSAGYDSGAHDPAPDVPPGGAVVTSAVTTVAPSTGETAVIPVTTEPLPTERRVRFTAVTLFGLLTGVVLMAGLFTTILSVESDTRLEPVADAPAEFRVGSWIADDLADNLSIGGFLAVLAAVVGGIAAIFRWRWGSGLAAGAGLAGAGLAVLTIGIAQMPIDAAEEFAAIPNEQVFTLTITRDIGYWLLVVGAALGIVLFFAALNDATGDRRSGLNPWIAALGALATVVAAGGPLIPENLADFSDNWLVGDGPGDPSAMLLVGRLIQLGLFLVAGLVGFLSVRRWGLGCALGGSLPVLWLAVSTLFEVTDDPVGPGYGNPGAEDIHLHGVTIIGMSAVLAMWVLAAIAAYDQSSRS